MKTYKKKKPNQQTKNQILKAKPIGNPKRTIEAVNKDIVERFSVKKNHLKILNRHRQNVVEYFSKYNDLVITKADKGGAKANEQLQDNSFCQRLYQT